MPNTFYCLECDADCGQYQYCSACEDNPEMENREHPGFISSAEIESEIQTENFWYEYDQR
jgi:hypothetical protein